MLNKHLVDNMFFTQKDGLFYQKDSEPSLVFERAYLALREKEGRVYSDEVVKHLPEIPDTLKKEWPIRKASMEMLIRHLKSRGSRGPLLELGCGNGWFSHNLAISLPIHVYGMDVNEQELLQAVRLFGPHGNLSFVYADIFTCNFDSGSFNTIILAGSIQYFPDLRLFLNRLLELLAASGEIFILDSPFYPSQGKAAAAKKRSHDYFRQIGFPEMKEQYFHHTLHELKDFNYRVLHNPSSVVALTKRKIFRKTLPVFPLIQIKHEEED